MMRARPDAGAAPRVTRVGAIAHAALLRSGGIARTLPGFEGTGFRVAAGEIVFASTSGASMHPRKYVTPTPGENAPVALGDCRIWHPPMMVRGDTARGALAAGCERLRASLVSLGEPRGFACVLAGTGRGGLPRRAVDDAQALALWCAMREGEALLAAALRLVGLGEGLTPSGDDFFGGALFGSRLVAGGRWRRTVCAAALAARERTHSISAALIADHAAGASFEPMHRLVATLGAARRDDRAVRQHARDLVSIGHSSGWDMLAGLIAGITGSAGPAGCAGVTGSAGAGR